MTKRSRMSEIFGRLPSTQATSAVASLPLAAAVELEARRLINLERIPVEENILSWWKRNSSTYPYLRKLAVQRLATQATSVPAERLFSKAGQIISARRSNLKPDAIDAILFLNKAL